MVRSVFPRFPGWTGLRRRFSSLSGPLLAGGRRCHAESLLIRVIRASRGSNGLFRVSSFCRRSTPHPPLPAHSQDMPPPSAPLRLCGRTHPPLSASPRLRVNHSLSPPTPLPHAEPRSPQRPSTHQLCYRPRRTQRPSPTHSIPRHRPPLRLCASAGEPTPLRVSAPPREPFPFPAYSFASRGAAEPAEALDSPTLLSPTSHPTPIANPLCASAPLRENPPLSASPRLRVNHSLSPPTPLPHAEPRSPQRPSTHQLCYRPRRTQRPSPTHSAPLRPCGRTHPSPRLRNHPVHPMLPVQVHPPRIPSPARPGINTSHSPPPTRPSPDSSPRVSQTSVIQDHQAPEQIEPVVSQIPSGIGMAW